MATVSRFPVYNLASRTKKASYYFVLRDIIRTGLVKDLAKDQWRGETIFTVSRLENLSKKLKKEEETPFPYFQCLPTWLVQHGVGKKSGFVADVTIERNTVIMENTVKIIA